MNRLQEDVIQAMIRSVTVAVASLVILLILLATQDRLPDNRREIPELSQTSKDLLRELGHAVE